MVTFSLVCSSCSKVVASTDLAVVVLGSSSCSVVISSDDASVVTGSSLGMSVVDVFVVSNIVIVVVVMGSGSKGGAGAHETPAASSRLI